LQKYGKFGAMGGGFSYMGSEVTQKPRASLRSDTLGGQKKPRQVFLNLSGLIVL